MVNQFSFDNVNNLSLKISFGQFFALEINDFTVPVIFTALCIIQLQADCEAEMMITRNIKDLPLHDAVYIHQGDVLCTNWNGIPPAKSYSHLDKEQKEGRLVTLSKSGECSNTSPAATALPLATLKELLLGLLSYSPTQSFGDKSSSW